MTDLPGGDGARGPLPPHERTWRHPSELAPPPLEPPTRGGRVLIISTATVSLLLVGVMALLMTPDRARTPGDAEAIETDIVTFVPAADAGAAGASSDVPVVAATAATTATLLTAPTTRAPSAEIGFGDSAPRPQRSQPRATVSVTIASAVVVTPIGDGLAVTTESAVGGTGPSINAVLPSGERVVAELVAEAGGLVFVEVDDDGRTPVDLAAGDAPTDLLFLSVSGSTVPIDPTGLAGVAIPEATPVLDEHGNLVGLCTYGDGGIEVVPVGTMPERPAPGVAVDSTTPVETAPATPAPRDDVPVSTPASASDPEVGSSVPASTGPETSSAATSSALASSTTR